MCAWRRKPFSRRIVHIVHLMLLRAEWAPHLGEQMKHKISVRKRLIAEILAKSKNRPESQREAYALTMMTTGALRQLKTSLEHSSSALPEGTDVELSGEAYEIYLKNRIEEPREPDWVLPEPRSRAMPGEGVMLECTDVVLSDAAYAVYAGAENKRDLGVPLPGKVGIQAHEEEGSVQQLSGKATTEARQPIVDRRKDEEKNKERK